MQSRPLVIPQLPVTVYCQQGIYAVDPSQYLQFLMLEVKNLQEQQRTLTVQLKES